jgi:flagellar biosynthetic protein FlhB
MADAGNIITYSFLIVSLGLVLIAAIDVPFQLWEYTRQLKMTRQEVRDEFKETDGHPEVRSKIRALQREMAQRRMMAQIPKADVIVTNPTHYAVALKYDQARMRAPVVVAKGADLVAANIRSIAEKNNVPILSAPPLARSLYYSTELDKEIPTGLYTAVAQILAYVYQLRKKGRYGVKSTIDLNNLPIPEGLRRDN